MRIEYNEGQPIHIYLSPGDGVFVHKDSSAEECVLVEQPEKADWLVLTGPMNINKQLKVLLSSGWKRV